MVLVLTLLLLILSLFLPFSPVILPLLLIFIIIRLIVYNDKPACDKLSLTCRYVCIYNIYIYIIYIYFFFFLLFFLIRRRKLRYFSVNFASFVYPPLPPSLPCFLLLFLDSFSKQKPGSLQAYRFQTYEDVIVSDIA